MKRTKKHTRCLAAILAALLLGLTACGQAGSVESSASGTAETVQAGSGEQSATSTAEAAQSESGDSSATATVEAAQSGSVESSASNTAETVQAGSVESSASGTDEATQAGGVDSSPSGTAEAAQAGSVESSVQSSAVTVTDMTGREITLDEPATRVVALTPSDCEILYAIGAGGTLVGRGEYCDYPAEVLDIPAVNSGSDTNIEQILELEPQVLLMSTMAQTEEQVQQLEDAGIRVVVSDAQDIAGTYTAIEMIGALMGKEEAAASVVDGMKNAFAEIEARADGDGSETIYFEVSPLEYGLWAAGSNTFMDEAAAMLGLTNCFADVDGWGSVSEEQVLERDPDYIVTITMYYGEGPTPEEEILSRPGWENVTAVKNNAILNLPDNELSRPGPRLADGAQALFDFVYGDAD